MKYPLKPNPSRAGATIPGIASPYVASTPSVPPLPPRASSATAYVSALQCAQSVRSASSGTTLSAVTGSPPAAAVNHPSKACPTLSADGSSPYAPPIAYVRAAVPQVPPFASNATACSAVQWAWSVRTKSSVTIPEASTRSPPSAAVHQPRCACPAQVGAGNAPYVPPITRAIISTGVVPPLASKDTHWLVGFPSPATTMNAVRVSPPDVCVSVWRPTPASPAFQATSPDAGATASTRTLPSASTRALPPRFHSVEYEMNSTSPAMRVPLRVSSGNGADLPATPAVFRTSNSRVTSSAASQFPFPAWLAVTRTVPSPVNANKFPVASAGPSTA